jgi:predicted ATPase with chaperone activity
MAFRHIKRHCDLDRAAADLLETAMQRLSLSSRA